MSDIKRLSFCTLLVCLGVFQAGTAWGQNGLTIGQGSAASGEVAEIPLSIGTDAPAQGFVMAFQWDAASATATELVVNNGDGQALAGAELVVSRVEASSIVLSVVVDSDGVGQEVIPAGQDIAVGIARIRCEGAAANEVALTFVDGSLATVDGGPALENTLVQGGLSITAAEGLALNNGTLTCQGGGPVEDCASPGDEDGDGLADCDDPDCVGDPACPPPAVEDCATAGDEDGDGLADCDDPDCANEPQCQDPGTRVAAFACGGPLGDDGLPTEQTLRDNGSERVTFYYRSSEPIQGLSMAIRHTCKLQQVDGSTDLEGGALAAADAEFVSVEVDDVFDDDDICELVVGILVDATAPFDGRKLPASNTFQKLFSHDFRDRGGSCDECLLLGYTERGDVPGGRIVRNLVSIDFQSQLVDTSGCNLCLVGEPVFIRGDCNLSNDGDFALDVADAAAQVGHIFLDGDAGYNAPCEDACDANDDGLLDAADIVYLLEFLFIPNKPEPPAPFPGNGPDPTADELDCEGGQIRC